LDNERKFDPAILREWVIPYLDDSWLGCKILSTTIIMIEL